MDRWVAPRKRVTSPTWGPPPPCKQVLTPSDFFLTPGGKTSATRVNIPQVKWFKVEPSVRRSLSPLKDLLGPNTKKKIMHIVFNLSLEDCDTQKKKIKNKGYANLLGGVSEWNKRIATNESLAWIIALCPNLHLKKSCWGVITSKELLKIFEYDQGL